MEEIKICFNKNKIRETLNRILDNNDKILIQQWLDEKSQCLSYLYYCNKCLTSFVLLRKCDFDPLHIQKNPYLLSFIYTFPESRRYGFARKIIDKIKNDCFEITACCINDNSVNFFLKMGFHFIDDLIARYP